MTREGDGRQEDDRDDEGTERRGDFDSEKKWGELRDDEWKERGITALA